MRNLRIAELLFNRPLMISEAKLNTILHVLGPRFNLDATGLPQLEAAVLSDQDRRRAGYLVQDGVAVIGIYGPLMHRLFASDYPSGGPTTYGEIATAFETAMADDGVQSILLDLDSPGGEVAGVFDLADRIYQARSIKPSTAVINEMAYSAGYLLASAAGRIVIPRTGGAGSVGVIATHADFSRAEDKAGITVTHVFAGARKADWSQHSPLSAEAHALLQESVNESYTIFTETVARNRGMTVDAVRATEAGCFDGKKAVAVGFADEVATVAQGFQIARQTKGRTVISAKKTITQKGAGPMTKEELQQNHPDLYQAILDDGKAQAATDPAAIEAARQEGAEAERQRIQAIEAIATPGHEKLLASLKFDGKTTAAEAALQVLGAENQMRQGALERMKSEANPAVPATATGEESGSQGVDENAPLEEQAKAEWDKSAALRSEFGNKFEAYVAYRRSVESGRAKILGSK